MKKILITLGDQAKYAAGYEKGVVGSKAPYCWILGEIFLQDLLNEIKHRMELL